MKKNFSLLELLERLQHASDKAAISFFLSAEALEMERKVDINVPFLYCYPISFGKFQNLVLLLFSWQYDAMKMNFMLLLCIALCVDHIFVRLVPSSHIQHVLLPSIEEYPFLKSQGPSSYFSGFLHFFSFLSSFQFIFT